MPLLVAEVSDFSTRTRLGVVFVGFGGVVGGAGVGGRTRGVFSVCRLLHGVSCPACLPAPRRGCLWPRHHDCVALANMRRKPPTPKRKKGRRVCLMSFLACLSDRHDVLFFFFFFFHLILLSTSLSVQQVFNKCSTSVQQVLITISVSFEFLNPPF